MSEGMNGIKRTHRCAELSAVNAGETVTLCGWVQRRRDLGGLMFLTLRDRSGVVQCVFNSETDPELADKASALRSEYTVAVIGDVALRGEKDRNPDMATGDIEVIAKELRVFSKADTTPFEIVENSSVNDVLRLKYRYLDLRRPDMQRIIAMRHRITQVTRRFFDGEGFYEIETPMLTKSTPEGARDYLVPSRVFPGKFFALPQSPQQYKQLLMLAGFDRYFQITRCMRDEDLRADRQPEFTQIDLEMSFVDRDDVLETVEKYMHTLFKEVLDVEIPLPIPRMSWDEAMSRYGSDKPDLRFGYEICDLSDAVRGCGFKVFDGALEQGGSVRGINIENGAKLSRKEIDALGEYVKTYRAKGLAWAKLSPEGHTSSFAKFVSEDCLKDVYSKLGAKDGDLVLIIADADNRTVLDALGALRCECARKMGTIEDGFRFLWVVDFPLFEYSAEEDRYVAMHHPFTAPNDEDVDLIETDPGKAHAKAYDMVLNGYELGGGSIRIHSSELQERMFRALGLSDETIQTRFGHLVEAFKYGAPPHGGLAFGLDRIVMLMAGRDNLRDVIAFPKVQNSSELMMASPDTVDQKQLSELHIACIEENE
ncbi:MAG: aspartate--tRNA ligase [Clostridia bacterium]|nr:aspartate--tRNA ligase [Clostridia bacterium]